MHQGYCKELRLSCNLMLLLLMLGKGYQSVVYRRCKVHSLGFVRQHYFSFFGSDIGEGVFVRLHVSSFGCSSLGGSESKGHSTRLRLLRTGKCEFQLARCGFGLYNHHQQPLPWIVNFPQTGS